jgi:hypothetical protein
MVGGVVGLSREEGPGVRDEGGGMRDEGCGSRTPSTRRAVGLQIAISISRDRDDFTMPGMRRNG